MGIEWGKLNPLNWIPGGKKNEVSAPAGEDKEEETDSENAVIPANRPKAERADKREMRDAVKKDNRDIVFELPTGVDNVKVKAAIKESIDNWVTARKKLLSFGGIGEVNEAYLKQITHYQNEIRILLGNTTEAEIILANISIDIEVESKAGTLEEKIYKTYSELGEVNVFNTILQGKTPEWVQKNLPELSKMALKGLSQRALLSAVVIWGGGFIAAGFSPLVGVLVASGVGAVGGWHAMKSLSKMAEANAYNEEMEDLNDVETKNINIRALNVAEQKELRKLRVKLAKDKNPKDKDITRKEELENKAQVVGGIDGLRYKQVSDYARGLLISAHRFGHVIGLDKEGKVDENSVPTKLLRKFNDQIKKDGEHDKETINQHLAEFFLDLDKFHQHPPLGPYSPEYQSSRIAFNSQRALYDAQNAYGQLITFVKRNEETLLKMDVDVKNKINELLEKYLYVIEHVDFSPFPTPADAEEKRRKVDEFMERIAVMSKDLDNEIAENSLDVRNGELRRLFEFIRAAKGVDLAMGFIGGITGAIASNIVRGLVSVGLRGETWDQVWDRYESPVGARPMPVAGEHLTSEYVQKNGFPRAPEGKKVFYYSTGWLELWRDHHGGRFPSFPNDTLRKIEGDYPPVPFSKDGTGAEIAAGGSIDMQEYYNPIPPTPPATPDITASPLVTSDATPSLSATDSVPADFADSSASTEAADLRPSTPTPKLTEVAPPAAPPEQPAAPGAQPGVEQKLTEVQEPAEPATGPATAEQPAQPKVFKEGSPEHLRAEQGLVTDENVDEVLQKLESGKQGVAKGEPLPASSKEELISPSYAGMPEDWAMLKFIGQHLSDEVQKNLASSRAGTFPAQERGTLLNVLYNLKEQGLIKMEGDSVVSNADEAMLERMYQESHAKPHATADAHGKKITLLHWREWFGGEKAPSKAGGVPRGGAYIEGNKAHLRAEKGLIGDKNIEEAVQRLKGKGVPVVKEGSAAHLKAEQGLVTDKNVDEVIKNLEKQGKVYQEGSLEHLKTENGLIGDKNIEEAVQRLKGKGVPVVKEGSAAQQRLMEERANEVLRRAGVVPAEVSASGSISAQAVGEAAAQTAGAKPVTVPLPAGVAEGITAQVVEQPVAAPVKVEPVVSDKITAQALDTEQKITGSAVSEDATKSEVVEVQKHGVNGEVPFEKMTPEMKFEAFTKIADTLWKQEKIRPDLLTFMKDMKVGEFFDKMSEIEKSKGALTEVKVWGNEQAGYTHKDYTKIYDYLHHLVPTKEQQKMTISDFFVILSR